MLTTNLPTTILLLTTLLLLLSSTINAHPALSEQILPRLGRFPAPTKTTAKCFANALVAPDCKTCMSAKLFAKPGKPIQDLKCDEGPQAGCKCGLNCGPTNGKCNAEACKGAHGVCLSDDFLGCTCTEMP